MIICPKCRQHAQITETGKNTLRCQRCGAILEARRLRILYSSKELADAVAFWTRLQAEISGKGRETFSLKTSAEGDEFSKSTKSINEDTEEALIPPRKIVSGNLLPKKDQKSIFLDLLESAGGKVGVEEFQQKALEKGISQEKFNLILKKLLETGELYSPEPGIVKLV